MPPTALSLPSKAGHHSTIGRPLCANHSTARARVLHTVCAVQETATPLVNPDAPAPKAAMLSLGCAKNTVDGEVMLGDLYRSGFDITDNAEDADVIVVNTCGFIEDAKSESLETIMAAAQLKADAAGKKLVVTGCLAQRYGSELAAELPEVDMVMGFEHYESLPATLRGVMGMEPQVDPNTYQQRARVQVGEATVGFRAEWDRHRLTPSHYAYLRVAEGCNHACTFCAIPGFRYVGRIPGGIT